MIVYFFLFAEQLLVCLFTWCCRRIYIDKTFYFLLIEHRVFKFYYYFVWYVITRTDIEKSDDSTSDASDDEFVDIVFSSIIYDYHKIMMKLTSIANMYFI